MGIFSNLGFIFSLLLASASMAALPPVPSTPKRPVTDDYQGTKITDNYRWLEDATDSEVKTWTENQNSRTRAYLDQLPNLATIKIKLQKWNDFKTSNYRSVYFFGKNYFALKLQPPKNQPFIVTFSSPDKIGDERVLVDPNAIDPTGKTAIGFFVPSLDGKIVAVSLSQGGSEEGTLHIYDVQTGKELPDQIPLVTKPTGGGDITWNKDGTGFYYTRYPRANERAKEDLDFYQQVYFHQMGTPVTEDKYSLGKDFPRIAETRLSTSRNGHIILAAVANGDGGEFAHYILLAGHDWVQLTHFKDKIISVSLGLHDDLYLLSRDGSPKGKILKLQLTDKTPTLDDAKVIVKEGAGVITEIVPTENRLYVTDLVGGPSDLRVLDNNGKLLGKVNVPPISDVSEVAGSEGDEILFKTQSYVQPTIWYRFNPQSVKNKNFRPTKTAMIFESPVNFNDIEVKREMATSKDGVKVPLTIMYRKGTKLDGKNPTILYGYGGYGINLTPRFQVDNHLWLERGGVYAVANLRGGGEFGEDWHLAGNLTKKQNVFNDFIACAEQLIKKKYSNPEKLAIEGGSNGGLLMGAVLTQRPDLFHVVVSHVGIYDMLRVEHDPNGAFNVTEFGTVKDPDEFKALLAYSPYHHVVDGTKYPPVLLLTGANDGRVNPYHSKKMAARLQEASPAGTPVLLRVTFDGGHGIGRSVSQKVAEEADVYAFLFDQLGMN